MFVRIQGSVQKKQHRISDESKGFTQNQKAKGKSQTVATGGKGRHFIYLFVVACLLSFAFAASDWKHALPGYQFDFSRDHAAMLARGVRFLEAPRHEPYGTVAVFEDLYGNKWDLLEPKG